MSFHMTFIMHHTEAATLNQRAATRTWKDFPCSMQEAVVIYICPVYIIIYRHKTTPVNKQDWGYTIYAVEITHKN